MLDKYEQEDYTDLSQEKVVYKTKDLSEFKKFKVQIKQGINPIILDQEKEQNLKEIKSLQSFIDDPIDELEFEMHPGGVIKNLRIASNNREEIFSLITEICMSFIKEEELVNSKLNFLYKNKVSKIQIERDEVDLDGISQTIITIYLEEILN